MNASANLPADAVATFWLDVTRCLLEEHKLKPAAAFAAIGNFRTQVVERHVGEVIYNRNPEAIAAQIANGWNSGLLHDIPTAKTA